MYSILLVIRHGSIYRTGTCSLCSIGQAGNVSSSLARCDVTWLQRGPHTQQRRRTAYVACWPCWLLSYLTDVARLSDRCAIRPAVEPVAQFSHRFLA